MGCSQGDTLDLTMAAVNEIMEKITCWCTHSSTEDKKFILKQKKIVGPLQEIKLCNTSVKRVYKAKCLGLTIDSELKFRYRVHRLKAQKE